MIQLLLRGFHIATVLKYIAIIALISRVLGEEGDKVESTELRSSALKLYKDNIRE